MAGLLQHMRQRQPLLGDSGRSPHSNVRAPVSQRSSVQAQPRAVLLRRIINMLSGGRQARAPETRDGRYLFSGNADGLRLAKRLPFLRA